MNAIISGKMEKQVGSMVFKTLGSASIPSDWSDVRLYDITSDQYIRIIDKAGNVFLVRSYNLMDYQEPTLFRAYKNNNNDSDVAVITYQGQISDVFVGKIGQYSRWSDYVTSIERGTLEIS